VAFLPRQGRVPTSLSALERGVKGPLVPCKSRAIVPASAWSASVSCCRDSALSGRAGHPSRGRAARLPKPGEG